MSTGNDKSCNRYVVGLGEVLWDILPDGKKLGGAPANFAYHAGQFLDRDCVIAISALGHDDLADETVNALNRQGLKFLMPRVPYPTGVVNVTLDDNGIPDYHIQRGVAWDHIPFTPEIQSIAARCRAVCYGSLAQRHEASRESIHHFLDATPDDCLKIFDINLRQDFYTTEIIKQSIEQCNILKINDEELDAIRHLFGYGSSDPNEVCQHLLNDYHLDMLVLTCGTNGSSVFSQGHLSHLETPQV